MNRSLVPSFGNQATAPGAPVRSTVPSVGRQPPLEDTQDAYAPTVPLPQTQPSVPLPHMPSSQGEMIEAIYHRVMDMHDRFTILEGKVDSTKELISGGAQARRNQKVKDPKEIGDANGPKTEKKKSTKAIHSWLKGQIIVDDIIYQAFANGGNDLYPAGGMMDAARVATSGNKAGGKRIIPDGASEADIRAGFSSYVFSCWTDIPKPQQEKIREFRAIYEDPEKGPAVAYATFKLQ